MQAIHRVAKNTGILYARMAITVFISLYATRILLGALGVEDFGLFNVVGGAIAMLTFLNTAMAAATQRFISYAQGAGDYQRLKTIFNVSIVLHFSIAIIILLILEGVGYFLFNGILTIPGARLTAAKIVFHFMVASTFFTIISVPYDAVINAHENMLLFAILGIIESILKLGIAFYISYSTFDKLATYGGLMAGLSTFLFLLRFIFCHKYYTECQIGITKYYSKPLFKEMTKFAGWSFLGSSTSMLAGYGQVIVINMFFGPLVNAAHGIGQQVSGQLGAFAGTMLKALNPIIAKSEGAGNRSLMLKASMMGSKVSFFLLMLFYIPVMIEMPYIFKLWLKQVPEYAVIFCQLVLIRTLIEQLYNTLIATIAAVGNIRKFQIYSSILNLFPLIISYILFLFHLPAYSIFVVFIVYSIINGIIVLYFAKSDCDLSIAFYLRNVVSRSAISFSVVFLLSLIPYFFIKNIVFQLFLVIAISTISFLIVVWYIGFTEDERVRVGAVFKNVLRKVGIINKIIANQ